MPLRPLAVSVLIFIFLIIGIYWILVKLHHNHVVYTVVPNQRWIGVIDMDHDHGIDMEGIIQGHDSLLVIDNNNPIFQQLMLQSLQTKPFLALSPFEIGDYDSNGDGLLDNSDPIYPYLHIVTFNPNASGYQSRTLAQVGIRGIKISHNKGVENHQVILSDGSTRTLYEINKAVGTSVYMNSSGKQVTTIPQIPNNTGQ